MEGVGGGGWGVEEALEPQGLPVIVPCHVYINSTQITTHLANLAVVVNICQIGCCPMEMARYPQLPAPTSTGLAGFNHCGIPAPQTERSTLVL